MAGIPRTESIIADSTASSSSPSRPTAENQTKSDASALVLPPNEVKRVSRTYGRPKPNNTGDIAREDLGWRARILKTAPRDADAQVIPESDDLDDRDPKFGGFDWRAKLKAIDDDFDDSRTINLTTDCPVNASASLSNDAPDNVENGPHSSVLTPLSGLSHLSLAGHDQRITGTTSHTAAGDSLFSGSQCTLLTSNPLLGSPRFAASGDLLRSDEHNSVTVPKRPHFSPERVLTSPEASGAENTSPKHPYAINSPNNQSSPTPPTSPFAEEPISNFAAVSGDDSADDGSEPVNKSRRSTKGKAKEVVKNSKERMKAPTKKDVLESRKESARLLADQHVSIRRTETQTIHTIANLFNKLKNAPTTLIKQDSDPITSFSSPGHLLPIPSRKASLEDTSPSKPSFTTSGGSSWPATALDDSSLAHSPPGAVEAPFHDASDEYLPDPDALLRAYDGKRKQLANEEIKRAEAERRAKDLEDRKRKALELSKLRSGSQVALSKTNAKMHVESDSDDDLEIVEDMVSLTAPARGQMSKGMISSIHKPNTGVRGRRVKREGSSSSKIVSQRSLEVAARPAFVASRIKHGSKQKAGQGTSVSHNDLNSLLLRRAGKQSGFIEERKKEQWVKAGGVLRERHSGADAEGKSVVDWLHQGASREDAMAMDVEYDKDDDAEDPEYTPSDVGGRRVEESGGEEDEHETPAEQDMDVSDVESNVDTDKENHRPPIRRQPARVIVDSDEEDNPGPHADPSRPRPFLAPDTSFAEDSGDSPGEDKENSAELAFDLSEDKENAKVPRHLPRGRVVRADASLFPGTSDESGIWTSRQPLNNLDIEGEPPFMPPLAQRRDSAQGRILQVLHEEERHPPLSPVTPAGREVLRGRTPSSSPGSINEHTEDPKILLGGGFSQLFGSADGEELAPVTALGESGFSQFFSPGAVPREPRNKDRASLVNRPGLAQDDDDFQFTQTTTLLPSVKISESQRREVDEMFGKDQEFKLDEAKRTRDAKSSETSETRLSSTPGFLDFRSFAPSQPTQLSPPSIRRPLETLSLDSGDTSVLLNTSPGDVPFTRGRLLRGRLQRPQASPSPSPVPRNAFDVLRDAARSKAKERPLKPRLEKSEFVEVEAQESDEEAMLGFGGTKGDDEEEGGDDDPDAVVQGLVDDTAMDDKAQAADLVLEKHMEHQAEDDAAIEKLHQDAVAGKLRGKRRDRGLGFEESDSEDEDYKGRKPLYKKRRVEGDTLESYGQNPETRAFYDTYQAELAEEADPRLAHLQQMESVHLQDGAENDSSEEEQETIDSAEVRQRLRELPRRDTSLEPGQELHDLSWLEDQDEDMSDDFNVEERPFRLKKLAPQILPSLDHLDYLGASNGKKHHAAEQAKLKSWATQEARSHSSTSGRGGFSRKEDANNGVSQKQRRGATTGNISAAGKDERTLIAKKSSLMSQMEKRKGFDS